MKNNRTHLVIAVLSSIFAMMSGNAIADTCIAPTVSITCPDHALVSAYTQYCDPNSLAGNFSESVCGARQEYGLVEIKKLCLAASKSQIRTQDNTCFAKAPPETSPVGTYVDSGTGQKNTTSCYAATYKLVGTQLMELDRIVPVNSIFCGNN